MHIVYLFFILVVFPESLSIVRQLEARKRHLEEVEERQESEKRAYEGAEGWRAVLRIWGGMLLAKGFWFLKPLALLLPKKRGEEKEEDRPVLESRGRKIGGRSWELTKIAIGCGSYVMVMVRSSSSPRVEAAADMVWAGYHGRQDQCAPPSCLILVAA